MGRSRQAPTSADIDEQIRRLQAERERAIAAEDQQRGALVRDYLAGRNGDTLRTALERVVGPRDAYLFGLAEPTSAGKATRRNAAAVVDAEASRT